MVIVQILGKLPFPSFIVFAAMPDFQLDDKLFPKIIHYDIRAPLIPCLCLDIVIPCAVDNRFQIYQENPASLFFNKFLVPLSEYLRKILDKLFQDKLHVKHIVPDKANPVAAALGINVAADCFPCHKHI